MSIDVIRAALESEGNAALVTVIRAQGSVPRHAGSKMLVRRGGSTVGTVGGGRGEAAAENEAARCITERESRILAVQMQGTEALGPDMVCGGIGTMLVEFVGDIAPYRAALSALEAGRRIVMVKRMRGMSSGGHGSVDVALLEESGQPAPGFDLDSRTAEVCMATGRPHLEEDIGLFYDPVLPREKMLILGAGHIGKVLATMACELDFDVTVVDDRGEFVAPGRFPTAVRTVRSGYEDAVKAFAFDAATYVVIVTRGHLMDLECIRAVLGRTYRYAGFIGSSRKAKLLREQAIRDGFDASRVDALRAPIGIDIAAETPAEIAISILAQVVAARRGAGDDVATHAS